MNAVLVSIVLPTYNRAQTLPRSIGSVLAQSVRNFELIVVDDGSQDDTAAVVAGWGDPRIRYVRRERNGGVAAARNTGVAAANGRYLAFQDSDDEWLPAKLEKQLQELEPLDDRAMTVCGVLRTGRDADGQPWQLSYPRQPAEWERGLDWAGVVRSGVAYTQSWLVPRQAIVDAGGFDERLCIWDDWELLIRLARHVRIRPSTQPLVVSERGADSLSGDPQRFARDLPLILAKHQRDLAAHPALRAALLYLLGLRLYKAHRPAEARVAALRALVTQPTHGAAWRLLARTLLEALRP